MALGFFDGVHIAHRDLLATAKDIARKRGLAFGIFTFASGGGIKAKAGRLYNDDEKAEIRKYSEDMGLPYEFIRFSKNTV